MNEEKFTGYNPIVAKYDIEEFEKAGMNIYDSVVNANEKFMNNLSKVWFSQYASEFGEAQTNNLYLAQNAIKCLVNNWIVKCVSAYNKMAESNSATIIQDNREPMVNESLAPNGTGKAFDDFLTAGPDGVVGMDKDKVNTLLDNYATDINTIVTTQFDSFPLSIAFFDPNNALKDQFKIEVEEIKSNLIAKIDDVYKGVNAHITDEENKVIEAEFASEAALSGSDSTSL